MSNVSPSYNPKACCGAMCHCLDCFEDQPCWGDVQFICQEEIGDDSFDVHACKGHVDFWNGPPVYLTEP